MAWNYEARYEFNMTIYSLFQLTNIYLLILFLKWLAKSDELKKQIQILQQVHDRHLDRKNTTIENLGHDLIEAEEQFSTALQSHLINIDTLIDLQNARLSNLKNRFEGDLNMLDSEFSTER